MQVGRRLAAAADTGPSSDESYAIPSDLLQQVSGHELSPLAAIGDLYAAQSALTHLATQIEERKRLHQELLSRLGQHTDSSSTSSTPSQVDIHILLHRLHRYLQCRPPAMV